MAGYFIYSLDAQVFQQLTTTPTQEQGLILADVLLEELEDALDEYDGRNAADKKKWPADRKALATVIQQQLAAPDWYAEFTMGDAAIWDTIVLRSWDDEAGETLELDFACDNDGFLYWDAATIAASHGAPMMAEPKFGNSGFRYSGKSRSPLELMYTMYLPAQVKTLLNQLEQAARHFETLPDEEDGDRAQFFEGLLDPVRNLTEAGRVMWVQTDT
jgi:hypothetical protein